MFILAIWRYSEYTVQHMNNLTSNYGLGIGLFLIVFFAPLAHAEGPVIRSGETVGVEAGQVLEGDFYALGQTITISGEAERDVYALGGSITINAPVAEDLTLIAGVTQIHGAVNDDIRVIGGDVVIAGPVLDDVVVIGGTVHILSTASVGGDLIFFGGEIRVDGPVAGTVYGTGENIRIDSHIGGDVNVRARQSLTLGDRAEVTGNINYKSVVALTRGQNAVVTGTISHDALFTAVEKNQLQPLVLNVLVLIFSALTVFFILRTRTEKFVRTILDGYGRLGLIGLGMFLAIPIVSVILMASIVGFLVGLSLLLVYAMLALVALMFLPIFCGALVQKITRLGETLTIFTILLGVAIVVVLPFIPVLGGFVLFLGFLMITGALYTELYRYFKAV